MLRVDSSDCGKGRWAMPSIVQEDAHYKRHLTQFSTCSRVLGGPLFSARYREFSVSAICCASALLIGRLVRTAALFASLTYRNSRLVRPHDHCRNAFSSFLLKF